MESTSTSAKHSTRAVKDKLLSRREIEGLLADGKKVFIYNGKVLKVDAWIPYHPGGDLAILHMVGKDATDEINALHSREVQEYMNRYVIGKIEGRWENFLPPIQGGVYTPYTTEDTVTLQEERWDSSSNSSTPPTPVFDPVDMDSSLRRRRCSSLSVSSAPSSPSEKTKLTPAIIFDARTKSQIQDDLLIYPALDPDRQDMIIQRYRVLHERVEKAGLFECYYSDYGIECIRYSIFLTTALVLLHYEYYFFSSVFLGIFWHQLAFVAHDSGHAAITHNYVIDTCIGIFVANFIGGLSEGWWKRSHNVHHIITNSTDHDPDIQHLPFFAISHRFFDNVRSTYHNKVLQYDAFAKVMIRVQHFLYYPILMFGRFNLYVQSMIYLVCGQGPKKGPAWWHRWLEGVGLIVFWTWFGYGILYLRVPGVWTRLMYLLISHMVTSPLHLQIVLSHFAMSTADLGVHESFPQRMLRTTMDVDCPRWLDFFHGGLQFQAIHHLFPRMPRHNLRKAQPFVQEFSAEVGIPYSIYGFYDGNKKVIGRLSDIAQQARYLAECQKVCAEQGVFADH